MSPADGVDGELRVVARGLARIALALALGVALSCGLRVAFPTALRLSIDRNGMAYQAGYHEGYWAGWTARGHSERNASDD